MTRPSATLNELVEALNDGIAFFGLAAERSTSAAHIELFQRVRHLKETIAADLRAEVARNGDEPAGHGSWLGSFRQSYADLRARLASDSEASFIAALEEQEDRIVAAFRDATAQDQPQRVRELAASYLPEVEQMHDSLRALQRTTGR
ncbi:PA2169 family four-helix-bundle protein [Arenimonas terrae]|uniref:PA2169 family four-helix-bundle protein n=1 Tax=Arenimonas terrae TaxID=2546226 RepID=A0A5C4RPR7_9GAMM|nr:PA2169 family four-helix-bundle protein [Arenimonas terrae]TNJ33253.1 PA2169 family four-helix-bundle protein [Arenimonas terrae]